MKCVMNEGFIVILRTRLIGYFVPLKIEHLNYKVQWYEKLLYTFPYFLLFERTLQLLCGIAIDQFYTENERIAFHAINLDHFFSACSFQTTN